MRRMTVIVFVISTFSLILSEEDDTYLMGLYNKTLQTNINFPCRVPQPSVMSFHKIATSEQAPHHCEYVDPTTIVLHRCASTGCCKGKKTCQPIKSQPVKLVFSISHIRDSTPTAACYSPKTNPIRYELVEAINHTECYCRSGNNLPK